MVKITVCLMDESKIEIQSKEYLYYAIRDELENPKHDFVTIGESIVRKTEIKYIDIKREDN